MYLFFSPLEIAFPSEIDDVNDVCETGYFFNAEKGNALPDPPPPPDPPPQDPPPPPNDKGFLLVVIGDKAA